MPLVSFILFTYNQERFVREAILGAFAQTYPHLEIILSDDCSTDQTFNIIREMGESYQGPHRIVINRNERNLGSIEHVNLMLKNATGDFVVMAAGDDISHARRSEILTAEWIRLGKPLLLHSKATRFLDSSAQRHRKIQPPLPVKGANVLERVRNFVLYGNGGISGATIAVSKKMYGVFGSIGASCFAEDKIFALRALLADRTYLVDAELIDYRIHQNNLSAVQHSLQVSKAQSRLLEAIELSKRFEARWNQALRDVVAANQAGMISASELKKLQQYFEQMRMNEYRFLQCRFGPTRAILSCRLWLNRQRSLKWFLKCLQTSIYATPTSS